MDASRVPQLIRLLASLAAPRVLALSSGNGDILAQVAAALPADGALFAFEPDPRRAASARERLSRAGVAGNVQIMIGAPARLLHKVAGPFDVIITAGAVLDLEAANNRIRELLRPGGTLIVDADPGDQRRP